MNKQDIPTNLVFLTCKHVISTYNYVWGKYLVVHVHLVGAFMCPNKILVTYNILALIWTFAYEK